VTLISRRTGHAIAFAARRAYMGRHPHSHQTLDDLRGRLANLRADAEEDCTITDSTGELQLYCYREDGKMHYEYSLLLVHEEAGL
jgi:hypothetical protein